MTEHARRKQSPIPDEPRARKKAVRKRRRSDHRHEYELVAIDDGQCCERIGGEVRPLIHIGVRCRICGRLDDVHLFRPVEDGEGLRRFEVDGPAGMLVKYLPDELGVRA